MKIKFVSLIVALVDARSHFKTFKGDGLSMADFVESSRMNRSVKNDNQIATQDMVTSQWQDT